MSSEIDWGKAPADATHHQAETDNLFECWIKPGYAVRVSMGSPDWIRNDTANLLIATGSAAKRTATPSWSGEGLPPVGVACEIRHECWIGWERRKILYASRDYLIVEQAKGDEQHYHMASMQVRPIRAPEQIEADEREAAIRSMISGFDSARSWLVSDLAGFIYDKGYRKP